MLKFTYICDMEDKAINTKAELSERTKVSRETLGKFFYDLAKLTFATMVLGGLMTLFTEFNQINYWAMIVCGFFFTCGFAYTGNKILKHK